MAGGAALWFALIEGREAGPMTSAELAICVESDAVTSETFVWKDGMSEWAPAARVAELAPMFAPPPAAPARPPPPPAAALKAPAIVIDDEEDDSTVAEMLPLGEQVHQEEIAKSLFSTGEHSASGRTGAFAIDELKWAYARASKPQRPQDAKAAALARAIDRTRVKPALPDALDPVTPAAARTPSAGPRRRSSPPPKRKPPLPRGIVVLAGFGAGAAVVAAAIALLWLLR